MSVSLREIPGIAELLASTQELETATREDAWIGASRTIGGFRARVMTVRDYTALLQFESPLLNRSLPTPTELAFFLWVISPEMERWQERVEGRGSRGWRALIYSRHIQQFQSRRHGKRVRRAFRLAELEEAEKRWHAKAPGVPFAVPDGHPFTVAIKEAFEYIDDIFRDKPAGLKKNGTQAGLCYLTSWFDLLQSEYHLPTAEIWRMRLPILFARVKAIATRNNVRIPEFNPERDKILQNILRGLKEQLYTEEDLRQGRVDLERNCLRNN